MEMKKTPGLAVTAVATFLAKLGEETGDTTMGVQQVMLLLALHTYGEINQLDLKRYIGVEKSAVSRNIARLGPGAFVVKAGMSRKVHNPGLGLVEAFEDPLDRRINLVRLTARGRQVVDASAHAMLNTLN